MKFTVIKENDLFFVSNSSGDAPHPSLDPFGYGLFTRDTRVLSQWTWTTAPSVFVELASDVSRNFEAIYHYTNREWRLSENVVVPRESLYATRRQFVDGHRFYEQGEIENFSTETITLEVAYEMDADFLDMFEVRAGQTLADREQLKRQIEMEGGAQSRTFRYMAKDGTKCTTTVRFSADHHHPSPFPGLPKVGARLRIPPRGKCTWVVSVTPSVAGAMDASASASPRPPAAQRMDVSLKQVDGERRQIVRDYENWLHKAPRISGCKAFTTWYYRGLRDVRMLLTDIGHGRFPVAGVPWYAVPFGRDSLITALQMLPADAEVARGTLATMAAFQGRIVDPSRDEEPGKIMHELRAGELTRTGKVPFGPYYGTIDATPLFLNLAADYAAWTADQEWLQTLLPAVDSAFMWIERYGDRDGDGFVEYLSEAAEGISNQGWKDSGDAIQHKEGTLATGPIALCEVQGYVFRAYRRWGEVFAWLHMPEQARHCQERADRLRRHFIESFWLDDEDAVALALDGNKRPVRTLTSNMGQVLWSEILPQTLADRVIDRMLGDDMFSGFGVRTLSANEISYNPLSYHNGSVWPHDNSLIIAGMAKYGRHDAVAQLVEGMLTAAEGFELFRLPELFAGIDAKRVSRPVPYPVSCSPQAWAAASPVLILAAMLGLNPDVPAGRVYLNPSLPISIPRLKIESIGIGNGKLSIDLHRTSAGQTQCHILANTTGLSVHQTSPREVIEDVTQ
ncbi:amylo-alpha-1,6-glucosidase [Alicyclobacillus shizuokensis]|uniref:amylo-alpha-1,6-glucosidase n=1 Tax=Alicyclobacillus shizuokensis TaxID=392014 RepID=UPI000830FB10|nr:glycogen debranching N-terminal domain-containing protein [Alicyclobacillus shizuokensis]MCL6624987.1 amylo-alpha-1,6-glucosidase [Alicyclobacillus shizuokensis]